MVQNRKAYQEAYDRALEGKSPRSFLDYLMAPFEDHYSRQSREEGARDGAAARANSHGTSEPQAG
jgi:hypothetical protein